MPFAPTTNDQPGYAQWHRYPSAPVVVDARGPGTPAHRWWAGMDEEAIYQNGKDRVGLVPILPFCSSPPELSSTAGILIGDILAVTSGNWERATVLTYQWVKDGHPITHATTNRYTVTIDDGGAVLACIVTGTNVSGSESQTSNRTEAVLPTAPVLLAGPIVFATGLTLGSELTVTSGTWVGAPTSISYQWLRDGTAIPGEVGSSYVLAEEDDGALISCLVIASNAGGSTMAISNSIGPVDTIPTGPAVGVMTWHGQVMTWHDQELTWPPVS